MAGRGIARCKRGRLDSLPQALAIGTAKGHDVNIAAPRGQKLNRMLGHAGGRVQLA